MRLGYIIFYVEDVLASVRFYEAAFGASLRFATDDASYAEIETGQTALAFASRKLIASQDIPFAPISREAAAPGVEIALLVDDVQAALDQAVNAGAALVLAPKVKPWGQAVAYVRDLNGVLIELCTPMAA